MADISVQDLIRQVAREAGIPEPFALAVAEHESSFNPGALGQPLPSGDRAIGVYQLLPATARMLNVKDPNDPEQNIRGGIGYLKQLLDQNQGDWRQAMRTYGGVVRNEQYLTDFETRFNRWQQQTGQQQAQQQVQAPPGQAQVPTTFTIVNGVRVPVSEAPQTQLAQPPTPPPRTVMGELGKFAKEATASVNPVNINTAVQSAFWHPIQTVKGIAAAQGQVGEDALEAYRRGDYRTAIAKGMYWLIPLIGPRLAQSGDWLQQGEIGKGLGAMADIGVQAATPAIAKGVTRLPGRILDTLNDAERAAVEWGMRRGISIDVPTALGNKFLRRLQRYSEATPLGSMAGGRSRQATEGQLAAAGQELEQFTHPGGVATPETAGDAIRSRLTTRRDAFNNAADVAYDRFRQIEQQHPQSIPGPPQPMMGANGQPVVGPNGQPIMVPGPPRQVTLPIDVGRRKAAFQPLRDAIREEWHDTQMARYGPSLRALDNFLGGPDVESASVVDRNLGRLKQLAREKSLPATARRLANQTIDELEQELLQTARRADPQAEAALLEGRLATSRKYDVIKVIDKLSEESVETFRRATYQGDRRITYLRRIEKQIPGVMPEIGRAWIHDLLDKATGAGGFSKEGTLWNQWDLLGDQTKELMFPGARHREDLSNFFLLAKKLAENPNKSDSALSWVAGTSIFGATPFLGAVASGHGLGTAALTALAGNFSAGAVAFLLDSPATARLLMQGVRLKPGTAAALTWGQRVAAAVHQSQEGQQPEEGFVGPQLPRPGVPSSLGQAFGGLAMPPPPRPTTPLKSVRTGPPPPPPGR